MLKYGDKVILTDHKKNKHTVTLKEGVNSPLIMAISNMIK